MKMIGSCPSLRVGMKHEMKMMKAQSGCAVRSCFSAISAKLQAVLSKLRKAESACQVF